MSPKSHFIKVKRENSSRPLAIIIPTRNRPQLLKNIVSDILNQTTLPVALIIVDSSDQESRIERDYRKSTEIHHLYTEIHSAAIQRNIGLDFIERNYRNLSYVAFLDDDVRIASNYAETLINFLYSNQEYVGVSGIAVGESKVNFKNWATDLLGITGQEGDITKAAVNIPVQKGGTLRQVETSWLIGCSIWKGSIVKGIRFETEFYGASIFEDVIFSYTIKKRFASKLAVLSQVILTHELSPIGRPSKYEFYFQWMSNRIHFQKQFPDDFPLASFYIRNIIIGLFFVLSGPMRGFESTKSGMGILYAILRSLKPK